MPTREGNEREEGQQETRRKGITEERGRTEMVKSSSEVVLRLLTRSAKTAVLLQEGEALRTETRASATTMQKVEKNRRA
jgi:hypothetical protein